MSRYWRFALDLQYTRFMAEASQVTSTEFQDEPKADATHLPAQGGSKLNANFYQRTWTTIIMILTFILVLCSGQLYSVVMVQLLTFIIFSQINSIKRNEEKEAKIPMTKYINWYIFFSYNYFQLGKFVALKLPYLGIAYPLVGHLLFYHSFVCFSLFIIGFLSFVLSLKQGFLKYQFRLFGWIILATLLCSTAAWLICFNIYQGLIYFIVPSLLIVINDIFAYLFGYFFGKHQLIALSPKKTWQGYIGGAISTCLFSIILTDALQSMAGTLCPLATVELMPFYFPTCHSPMLQLLNVGPFSITKLQAHFMVFSLFASTIGPFGGFFASGLKRSVKIKDFGNSIPGHGGVSDRMDCQFIMGAFVYFYHQSFIKVLAVSTSAYIISLLGPTQQLHLFNQLKNNLEHFNLV